MATTVTKTVSYTDADDSQIWLKGTGEAGQVWSPVISGIPSGAKIKSVTLTFANGHTIASPSRSSVYVGTSTSGTRVWTTSASLSGASATVDLASYITGNGTYNLYFFKSSSSNSNVYFTGIKITITYEKTGSLLNRAENGSLVTYALYRAENGSLVRYNAYHAENGALVKY